MYRAPLARTSAAHHLRSALHICILPHHARLHVCLTEARRVARQPKHGSDNLASRRPTPRSAEVHLRIALRYSATRAPRRTTGPSRACGDMSPELLCCTPCVICAAAGWQASILQCPDAALPTLPLSLCEPHRVWGLPGSPKCAKLWQPHALQVGLALQTGHIATCNTSSCSPGLTALCEP